MRQAARRAESEQSAGKRTLHWERKEPNTSIDDDGSMWDIVFDSYLMDETRETFLDVVDYVENNHKCSYQCYDDILYVLDVYRNDNLFALLAKVIHNFRYTDFETITTIIYETWNRELNSESGISPMSMAYLIRGISKNASQVSVLKLIELQQFVYSLPWPLDASIAIALLQIERQLNKLVPEQRYDFAAWLSVAEFAGEEAIQISRALVMHELCSDDRISLTPFRSDLPYNIRCELGDATSIEDDLIPTIEAELATRWPDCNDCNIVIEPNPWDEIVRTDS